MDLIGYDDGSFLSNVDGFANLDVMKNATRRAALDATRPSLRRYSMK